MIVPRSPLAFKAPEAFPCAGDQVEAQKVIRLADDKGLFSRNTVYDTVFLFGDAGGPDGTGLGRRADCGNSDHDLYPRGLTEVLELLGVNEGLRSLRSTTELAVRSAGPRLGNVLSAITADGQEGRWRTTSFPAPSGGPSISVSANRGSVPGGSSLVTVSSRTPMSTLFVTHDSQSPDGHFELPVSGTEVDLQLDFSQSLPEDLVDLRYAAANFSGAVGRAATHSFDVVPVGTGNLQVTVSWDTRADVDLHVVEPGGEEIFYDNRRSEAGGELDLDANRECSGDDVRNENIVWDAPPRGRYVVRVNYWSHCGVRSTDYVVRVNGPGHDQVYRGTFTGRGEGGGRGAGVGVAVVEWP